MKITIIIPVYNSEKYIADCLNTMLNQTYKNIEIILVDDGSTDNSLTLISKYNDKRIKVIKQNNSGANIARGNGIKNATGEYCLFIDSDDWIELNTVEILVNHLKNNDYDIIKFNGINEPSKLLKNNILNVNDKNKELSIKDAREILLTTNNLNNMCFSLYKTSILKKINTFNIKMSNCEDYLDNLEIYCNANKILLINNVLYHYRENNNSTTKNKNKKRIENNIKDFKYTFGELFEYAKLWDISDIEIINRIAFRIIDMTRANIINYLKCNNISKEEFLNIVNELTNTKSFNYIYNNISLKQIKNELKKKSLKYKIKNYKNIINLYNKNYKKLWKNYYILKVIK